MSVLIKMELPECCDKCPFKKYIGSDRLVCGITGYRFYAWEVGWGDKPYIRHETCTLIEVKRHGRLIDADALKEAFCGNCFADEKPMECSEPCMDMKIILEAPTIIPAEPCNDLAKPNNTIFAVQNADEAEGVRNMTVREAINLLAYGEAFYIKGAHSGKIYHKSYENKKEHLEKFLDEHVYDTPFFTDLYTPKAKYSQAYTYPVIGIWMSDYYICHPEELQKEES